MQRNQHLMAMSLSSLIASDENGQVVVIELESGQSEDEQNSTQEAVLAELDDASSSLAEIVPEVTTHVHSLDLTTAAVIARVQQDLVMVESIGLLIAPSSWSWCLVVCLQRDRHSLGQFLRSR